eukprot:CAMPEP_0196159638 /NCGR_PEP_ID=MMETSP0910-20130528/46421_1 /TAXON_ID=49265 /ORGANISM="Thalassiosira rotula, Strain GSO102" /LENGTH=94 /DNA_ID=CAMNT_0041424563 /DNA_START=633 /DNA_END=914 /DNA_ORIENTATION=+
MTPPLATLLSLLPSLLLATIIIIIAPVSVSATITISESGKQFHSRPASFGFNLEYGLQYVALLQVIDEDLHLCAGIDEGEENNNNKKGYDGDNG